MEDTLSEEYKVRNINLDKLSDHVRSQGFLSEEAALHLMDTIRCQRAQIEELEQNSCGDCTDGWKENRVEGRHACTCMTEMEPFQILHDALKSLIDHDGVVNSRAIARKALMAVSPLEYAESV